MSKFLMVALMACALVAPAAWAKEAPNTLKRERVNLNLQNVKIEDFIKMVGKSIGKNILLSQPIPGTLNFISSSPIYKDELMQILLAVLNQKGFTLVEDGSFLAIERSNTAVKRNLPIGKESAGMMRTEFIQVVSENVDIIAAKVRQFLSEGGKLLTIKETNSMIISDFPDNIAVIQRVVDEIQAQQDENLQVEFITLTNAKASRIMASVQAIAKNIINQKVETNKVDVLSDDATNSIILMASRENIEKLKPLILKMDSNDDSLDQKLTIIPLENSEAKNVVTSLTSILDKKKYAKETDKPMVSAYEELNAIVVSAYETDIDNIKAMVKILDVEKPQVFVRARIIELNNNMTDQIGIKYGLGGGGVTDAGLFSFAANLGGASMVLPTGLPLDLNNINYETGIVFGATIDFLAGNGAAHTLSEPTLLCVNNQESSIYVGKTESIVTSTVQGNQSTDLARNTYQRQDIGLTLKIKPRLSSGNKVTLMTTVTSEDIAGSSVAGQPSTTKREVVTTAIVQNGESVIIGGLIQEKERVSEQGIPFLRNIPLLGSLFDWSNETTDEVNLVIILTPYIVTSNEELSALRKTLYKLDRIQSDYEALIGHKLDERAKTMETEKVKEAPKKESEKSNEDITAIIRPARS